jgi:hypothetical protein
MKVEASDRPAVSTQPAASACLLDESLLDAPPTAHDCLLSANPTAKISATVANVDRCTVPRAVQNDL